MSDRKRSGRPDRLYAGDDAPATPFRFDQSVVDVFPDMIRRSVPGYELVLEQLGVLARRFAEPATNVYDLGCSLGAATLALRRGIPHRDCRIVAVDSSPAMVERCRQALARDTGAIAVDVVEADVHELELGNASLVVMNYTLQFIDPDRRDALVRRIHDALRPGGAFVLSEKLRADEATGDALLGTLHHDFKRANGYSELEISRKRSALEDVLRRDSWTTHRDRLLAAGFATVERWFQCYNFASIIALR